MRSVTALLPSLLLLSSTGLANAATGDSPPPAQLDVRAPANCTSATDIAARVRARSPRIRFIDEDAEFLVRAQFTRLPSGNVSGEVVLVGSGGKSSSRQLLARSCAEAAEAVALIIAVTLDPAGASEHAEASAADANRVPSQSGATAPSRSADLAPSRLASTANTSPGSSALSTSATAWRISAYVAGQSVFGPAPVLMPGIAVYAAVGLDRDTPRSFAVMLGATHVWTRAVELGGTASFELDAASIDACAIRLRLLAAEARLCGAAMVGRMSARGTETRNPDSVARPFAAVGSSTVFIAGLGGPIELSARAAVGASLIRDSFEFAPQVFHTVDAVTIAASLGIGLRLQ